MFYWLPIDYYRMVAYRVGIFKFLLKDTIVYYTPSRKSLQLCYCSDQTIKSCLRNDNKGHCQFQKTSSILGWEISYCLSTLISLVYELSYRLGTLVLAPIQALWNALILELKNASSQTRSIDWQPCFGRAELGTYFINTKYTNVQFKQPIIKIKINCNFCVFNERRQYIS